MTERPHPDMDRVREALRERDDEPEDEAPQPPEENEPQEDDGDT